MVLIVQRCSEISALYNPCVLGRCHANQLRRNSLGDVLLYNIVDSYERFARSNRSP